jgi:MFS family permease
MADSQDDSRKNGHALTVLRHRDFRLLWFGQLISTTGQQMQTVTLAWHLFNLTDSTFQVGLIGLFGILPFLVLSFIGGAVADRVDRKRVILATQTATMATTLVLTGATIAGIVTPALIYAVAFVTGATRAFDAPARQALIPNLVPRNELANALTLNTMLRQMATIFGPGVGGLIVGFAGVAAAYAINGLTFLAVIGALLAMGPVSTSFDISTSGLRSQAGRMEQVLGGLRFARGEPVVLSLLSLDFMVTILGSTRALMPAYARDVLGVGAEGLGLLYAAPAVGAVVGALVLGAFGANWRNTWIVLVISAAFGACVLGFGLAMSFPVALLFLFGSGLADVFGEVMRATIVQLRTPDEVRGRVTALSVMFTTGGPQLGQLQSGAIASFAGPAGAAVVGGAAVMGLALAFTANRHLRVSTTEEPAPLRPASSG